VGGCATAPQNEGTPATVAEVVTRIKADLDTYQKYDALASTTPAQSNDCKGKISFFIDNVKVSLTTQTDDTKTGTGSATLPVASNTLGLNLSFSQEIKGTQTLTFTLYPKPVVAAASSSDIDAAEFPIAASLKQLRQGLLEASAKSPCVSLVPLKVGPDGKPLRAMGPDGKPLSKQGPDGKPVPVYAADPEGNPNVDEDGKPFVALGADGKPITDAGGTFVFGFTVINTLSTGGTFKFVLFSLGATNSMQRQAGNTITVTFKARPDSTAAIAAATN